jgi:hypothetical protein
MCYFPSTAATKRTCTFSPILFPDDELFLSDLVFCESTHIELEVWPGPGQCEVTMPENTTR